MIDSCLDARYSGRAGQFFCGSGVDVDDWTNDFRRVLLPTKWFRNRTQRAKEFRIADDGGVIWVMHPVAKKRRFA